MATTSRLSFSIPKGVDNLLTYQKAQIYGYGERKNYYRPLLIG